MNRDSLRAVQAPLKQRYRDDPAAALVTMKAAGRLAPDISCVLDTGRAPLTAGLHPAAGGSGAQICAGDLLLQALVGCAGVTLNAVSTAMGIAVREASVRVEGDVDFRGTLGVAKDVPIGFREIRLVITLDSDATAEQRQKLLELTERHCVVFQTLRAGVPIKTRFAE